MRARVTDVDCFKHLVSVVQVRKLVTWGGRWLRRFGLFLSMVRRGDIPHSSMFFLPHSHFAYCVFRSHALTPTRLPCLSDLGPWQAVMLGSTVSDFIDVLCGSWLAASETILKGTTCCAICLD
ncbi:uncharacterized protein PV06_01463 [Exophiala oligosperma]|uniref:Uncharacterized protein n=1 Tax=Exophiala oligosperma TaxID=215243 RepID=A0A0D2ELZ5_9EURO|nr:uncharacterized protein PV06_01463 [Exophiala oligosperma]KIW48904.1 hypothetical protein PV06_01463 [Exophiala oligosperma]